MELYKIIAALVFMFSYGLGYVGIAMIGQKTHKPKFTKSVMISITFASVVGLMMFMAQLSAATK